MATKGGIDPTPRSVELSFDDLVVAGILMNNPQDPRLNLEIAQQHLRSLQKEGVLAPGFIPAYIGNIVRVISKPEMAMIVETMGAEDGNSYVVWATHEFAVFVEGQADGTSLFEPIPPSMIPLRVAKAVGLQAQPSLPINGSLELTNGTLGTLFDQARAGDLDAVAATVRAERHIDNKWLNALYEMGQQCRLFWKATSFWNDYTGAPHVKTVTVLDSGSAGLWFIEPAAEEKGESEASVDERDVFVRVKPVNSKTVWNSSP